MKMDTLLLFAMLATAGGIFYLFGNYIMDTHITRFGKVVVSSTILLSVLGAIFIVGPLLEQKAEAEVALLAVVSMFGFIFGGLRRIWKKPSKPLS